MKFRISANAACAGGNPCGPGTTIFAASQNEDVTLPLPTLGLQVKYNILPRLQAQLRFDWFHLQVSDVKGSIVEVYAGLEYRLFKHFALGAAYDFLDVQADYQKGKKGGWGVENSWSSVFAYAALYF